MSRGCSDDRIGGVTAVRGIGGVAGQKNKLESDVEFNLIFRLDIGCASYCTHNPDYCLVQVHSYYSRCSMIAHPVL